jgi:hypothetical protein
MCLLMNPVSGQFLGGDCVQNGFMRANCEQEKTVITVSVFLTRRPDLSYEQFSTYRREKHAREKPNSSPVDTTCISMAIKDSN